MSKNYHWGKTSLKRMNGLDERLIKVLFRALRISSKKKEPGLKALERTIMYSRLLPDVKTLNLFIENNLIFLNGNSIYRTDRLIYQNDLLQLVVSLRFYIVNRWLSNWSIQRVRKFKRLVYKKGLAGKHKLTKTKKQGSRYTPN